MPPSSKKLKEKTISHNSSELHPFFPSMYKAKWRVEVGVLHILSACTNQTYLEYLTFLSIRHLSNNKLK